MKLNFEEAAKLRDIINAIKDALHITHVELSKLEDYDVFAIEIMEKTAVVMRLFIREGKIVSTSHTLMHNAYGFEKEELYQRALFEFYNPMNQTFARHILIAETFSEQTYMSQFLSEKFGQKVTINVPQRGEKLYLTQMAQENAKTLILQHSIKNNNTLAEQMQTLFDLSSLPKRIEIFDNSHLGGKSPVGAMVVWDDGFDKSSYRRYELHHVDEYAQMKEMLERRINDFSKESPPDLWILDGGETLLKLAKTLLVQKGLFIDLLAIAKEKRDAKAYRSKGSAYDLLYNQNQSFHLPPSDKRLQFIQKLRDEAHRFAITYHQQKKRGRDMSLELQKIEGVGLATIKKLLLYFGTFEAIYSATQEELEVTVGKKLGANLFHGLRK